LDTHIFLIGGRGTGKTTSAKILARAVNCLNPKDGEPCNECEICKEILEGSLTDVVEMDAASNNSVDDIRAIRDEVNFLPTKAKYRVYIIDEVHMLTTGAFNALLKTLEEPPEHVKFILATTEPQKLPTTILSRCQRFDFKKITNENIVKRLKIICEESNIKITDEALDLIAVLAEGAMRDAISILERCCQESVDEIGVDIVKELVGIPSLEYISRISRSIFENNEIAALDVIDNVINSGKDLNNFLWEVIKYIKDILVFKSTGSAKLYSNEELAEIKSISELVSKERLLNTIYLLSDLENEIKWSSQKTIMFQTGIIKACMGTSVDGIEELRIKIENLENKLASGNYTASTISNNTVKSINTNDTFLNSSIINNSRIKCSSYGCKSSNICRTKKYASRK
jgi:DNA polymerase-3 subunit gamma/tau